jgi:hypothetical protein
MRNAVKYAIFTPRLGLLAMLGSSLVGLIACKDEDPCDPGWVSIDTGCWLAEQGGSGGTSATPMPEGGANGDAAAPSSGGAGDVEPIGNPDAMFGSPCQSNEDCGGPAPVCATDPLFYCSQIECQEGEANEGACPADWRCFKYLDNPSACVDF